MDGRDIPKDELHLGRPKDKFHDKVVATSYFASLRNKMLGSNKKSPSPVQVINISEDSPGSLNSSVTELTPTVEGDNPTTRQRQPMDEESRSNFTIGTMGYIPQEGQGYNVNGASLMQLPFPPGIDREGLGNAKDISPSPMSLSSGNNSDNSADFSISIPAPPRTSQNKHKIMSITKDLPMPPGKIPKFQYYSRKQLADGVH